MAACWKSGWAQQCHANILGRERPGSPGPTGGIQMPGVPRRPGVARLQGGLSIDSVVSLGSWKPRCRIQPLWEEAGKHRTGNAGCRRQSAKHCSKLKPRWEMEVGLSRQSQHHAGPAGHCSRTARKSTKKPIPCMHQDPGLKPRDGSSRLPLMENSCHYILRSWSGGIHQGCSDAVSFLVVGEVRLT